MGNISSPPNHNHRHQSPARSTQLRSKAQEGRLKRTRAISEEDAAQPSNKKRRQQLKVPTLERPLSHCARDFANIKVENIEAYVNRSLDERRREAGVAGKIKRELNPFLLYRKAHKSVAEELIRTTSNDSSHINPRISKLCGISWKHLEPPEVKTQYESWSKVEKERLKEAFPDYRYQPNKRQRGEEQELPPLTDSYGPPGDYGSQTRSQREFTPDLTGFGQTPPPRQDEAPWLRDCGSPGDALSLDFSSQHFPGGYMEDPFHQEHERSPLWGVSRDHVMMNHSWPLAHQHDPFKAETTSKIPTIDPKLYYDGLQDPLPQYHQEFVEGSTHVPPGQYLLSAPLEVASSRGPSPEPLGQPWASSIPGNESAFDYLTGNIDEWELGADSAAPI